MMTLLLYGIWVLAFVLAFRGLREAMNLFLFMLVTAAITTVVFDAIMEVFW